MVCQLLLLTREAELESPCLFLLIRWSNQCCLSSCSRPPSSPSGLIHMLPAPRCNTWSLYRSWLKSPLWLPNSALSALSTFPYDPRSRTSLVMVLTTQYCNDLVTFKFAHLCGSMRWGFLCVHLVHCWKPSAWHGILHWIVSFTTCWLNEWLHKYINESQN